MSWNTLKLKISCNELDFEVSIELEREFCGWGEGKEVGVALWKRSLMKEGIHLITCTIVNSQLYLVLVPQFLQSTTSPILEMIFYLGECKFL